MRVILLVQDETTLTFDGPNRSSTVEQILALSARKRSPRVKPGLRRGQLPLPRKSSSPMCPAGPNPNLTLEAIAGSCGF